MSSNQPEGKLENLIWSRDRGNVDVSKIDLSNCNLQSFPEELYLFKDIAEMINLGGNNISDLPPWLNEFSRLKIFFFANNSFEKIPSVIGEIPNLYMVSFKSNKIRSIELNSLPSSLGWLILTDNKFEELPTDIGYKLPKLKKLMLAGNRLASIPYSLSHCKELELIRLAGNRLPMLPCWLVTSLPRLSWLALAGNPVFSYLDDNAAATTNEIDWKSITLGDILGEGASGVVCQGSWNSLYAAHSRSERSYTSSTNEHIDVAVKLFKGQATSDGLPEDEMKATEVVGSHPNSINVHGRLINHPSNQLGLVLSLIPNHFYTLGGPPSFDTVTRDVYKHDQIFSLKFILQVLMGVASIAAHLHSKHIMHGDLYAHNTLVNRNTGFPLLGDFGAATRYDGIVSKIDYTSGSDDDKLVNIYSAIQGIEVRAFGCLMEDMIDRIDSKDKSREEVGSLRDLQVQCFHPNPITRPPFRSILTTLENFCTVGDA